MWSEKSQFQKVTYGNPFIEYSWNNVIIEMGKQGLKFRDGRGQECF